MRRQLGVCILLVLLSAGRASAGSSAAAPERLSSAEQRRILEQLCRALNDDASETAWAVEQDERGWVCRNRRPPDESPFSSELRWSSARRGRFVAADGEWLVSLLRGCFHGCRGTTAILERADQGWRVLSQDDVLVTDECVVLRATPGGFDRVACLIGSGPFQGFVIEALLVSSFAGVEWRHQRLLYKERGGECFLAEPPVPAEFNGDRLSELEAPDSGPALSVRLQVRRLSCAAERDDPESQAQLRAEHVLRFVWSGQQLVPDAASADLIRRYEWAEQP